MKKRLILHIFGNVQGIGYRYTVSVYANKVGVTGWIQNCFDDSVELLAEGQEEDLLELIQFCYNRVRLAKVRTIEKQWERYRGEFENFEIHYGLQ